MSGLDAPYETRTRVSALREGHHIDSRGHNKGQNETF